MASRRPLRPLGLLLSSLLGLGAALLLPPHLSRAMLRSSAPSLDAAVEAEAPRSSAQEEARRAEERAGALYAAGQFEAALAAQRASVGLHRELARKDGSQRAQLAASLHNLGVVLIRLGRKSEAIPPTEEALALYRTVEIRAGGDGTRAQERPLRNLVLLYFETNRAQAALPLADELVRWHQAGKHMDPRARAEGIDVLNLRASLLAALNRPEDALHDLQAAVGLARQLAGPDPQNLGLQYGLAGALVNLSQVADLLGQSREAIAPAEEAEGLLRKLAQVQPMLRGDWAKGLSRLGEAYARSGDPARALAPLRESISVLRTLERTGAAEPLAVETGGYRDDLAHALEVLGLVQQQRRDLDAARAAAEEALALYNNLAEGDPRYEHDVERTRAWLSTLSLRTPARH
jgi:tetratricopeptide (TPR) repeat protein